MPKSSWNSVSQVAHTLFAQRPFSFLVFLNPNMHRSFLRKNHRIPWKHGFQTLCCDLENQAGPQKIPQHPHEGMGARCRTLSALPSNHLHPQIVKWYEWLCTNRQGQLGTLSFYFWDFGVDFSWQNINSEVKRAKQSNHTGDDSRQLDSVFSVIRVFQDPKTRMRVWQ